jgi:hypothetical protein
VGGDLTKARVRLRCGFARCQAIKGSDACIEVGLKRSEIGIWVRDVYLFKFTDALQARLDHLAERKKSDILSAEEEAELAGLLELDRIFILFNAKIIAES